MRTAIVADIHGNLTALEAVAADVRDMAPDLVLHGGDLADSGSSPVEVVDLLASLGWQGVVGNTDEMLTTPEAFEAFAARLPTLEPIWEPLRQMAAYTRDSLGHKRLAWLRRLPNAHFDDDFALVHASVASRWQSPSIDATDEELSQTFCDLSRRTVVYCHIHKPFIRQRDRLGGYIANSGSVGQSHDGDCRASYLLLDDGVPSVRRIEYDLERECKLLLASGLPHGDWVRQIITTASPQMP